MCDKKTLLFVLFKVKYESISLCSNFRNERSWRESTTLLQTAAASLNISLVKFKAAVSQPRVLAFLVFIRNVLYFVSMRTYSSAQPTAAQLPLGKTLDPQTVVCPTSRGLASFQFEYTVWDENTDALSLPSDDLMPLKKTPLYFPHFLMSGSF